MINSPIILNCLSEILIEKVDLLISEYPELRISGCDLNSKSIWIENFEFIENGKKINQVYSKGKLEIRVHPNGKKVKEQNLEVLIATIMFNLFIRDREPISYYKWEYKKSSGLLKKEDRIDLLTECTVSEAFDKTLKDIITEELPKFRGNSKEKTISEDQLEKMSFFEPLSVSGATS
jgi:hypothetical protein